MWHLLEETQKNKGTSRPAFWFRSLPPKEKKKKKGKQQKHVSLELSKTYFWRRVVFFLWRCLNHIFWRRPYSGEPGSPPLTWEFGK